MDLKTRTGERYIKIIIIPKRPRATGKIATHRTPTGERLSRLEGIQSRADCIKPPASPTSDSSHPANVSEASDEQGELARSAERNGRLPKADHPPHRRLPASRTREPRQPWSAQLLGQHCFHLEFPRPEIARVAYRSALPFLPGSLLRIMEVYERHPTQASLLSIHLAHICRKLAHQLLDVRMADAKPPGYSAARPLLWPPIPEPLTHKPPDDPRLAMAAQGQRPSPNGARFGEVFSGCFR